MDANIIELFKNYVIPSYTRNPIVITKGKGSWVWDTEGNKYLDLFPGWGVSFLGHCHPKVVEAVKHQIETLIHMPNNFYMPEQGILARMLIELSFPGKCFFCNSGAEANEAAIKLARRFGNQTGRFEIITAFNSFHGRTLTTITATGQEKYQKGFEPLVPGFKYVPYGDIEALKTAIGPKTCAIMLEPIQGEGGVNVPPEGYLEAVNQVCKENYLLFILDEVQTGIGRTGKVFAFQHYNIQPDIVTLAKALGSGFPIGAIIARTSVADILQPGTHASTFGGNPIACRAGITTIETIQEEGLLEKVIQLEIYIKNHLSKLKQTYPQKIKEVRGKGLMWGIEFHSPARQIFEYCLKNKLILNCTHETVIRLMPAVVVEISELAAGFQMLEEAIKNAI